MQAASEVALSRLDEFSINLLKAEQATTIKLLLIQAYCASTWIQRFNYI